MSCLLAILRTRVILRAPPISVSGECPDTKPTPEKHGPVGHNFVSGQTSGRRSELKTLLKDYVLSQRELTEEESGPERKEKSEVDGIVDVDISGNWSVDQPRSIHLAEVALAAAGQLLKPGGAFIAKVFQGEGFEELVRDCRGQFGTVRIRKPSASRAESREMYVVAIGFRLV